VVLSVREDVVAGSGGKGSTRLDQTVPFTLESDRAVPPALPSVIRAGGW
jgi:hypothetical protein